MTEPTPIRFTAPCPSCGADTEWTATPNPVSNATAVAYVIACDCDVPAGECPPIEPVPLPPRPLTYFQMLMNRRPA